jgi:hypothetical protein
MTRSHRQQPARLQVRARHVRHAGLQSPAVGIRPRTAETTGSDTEGAATGREEATTSAGVEMAATTSAVDRGGCSNRCWRRSRLSQQLAPSKSNSQKAVRTPPPPPRSQRSCVLLAGARGDRNGRCMRCQWSPMDERHDDNDYYDYE